MSVAVAQERTVGVQGLQAPLAVSSLSVAPPEVMGSASTAAGCLTPAAFLVFGLGSWITINGIFIESSFLVQKLPEGYNLTTWIVVALQVGNLFVLLLLKPFFRATGLSLGAASACLLLLGCCSSVFLSVFHNSTAYVFHAERSVGLLVLTFFCGFVSCASSVVFYPLAASYPRSRTTALAVGEGLSGSVAGVMGLLQQHLEPQNHLAFSSTSYFTLVAAVCIVALGALGVLLFHPVPIAERSEATPPACGCQPVELGACADSTDTEEPSNVMSSESQDEQQLTARTARFRELGSMSEMFQFKGVFLTLFLGSALSFGLLPSLNPIACLAYPNGQEALLWSNVMVYGFDPISRLAAAFLVFRRFDALILVFSAAAALVVVIAAHKEAPPGGGWLPVLGNTLFAAVFSYARTVGFLVLKDEGGAAVEPLYRAAGISVQAGSFCGSVAALLLVEVAHAF